MDLILLQKVTNLGNLGDKVSVKPGYGRNFLVPQGKAVPATAANVEAFETKRAEYEAKASSILADAQSRATKFEAPASPSARTRRPKASCTARLARATSPRRSLPPACRWKRAK